MKKLLIISLVALSFLMIFTSCDSVIDYDSDIDSVIIILTLYPNYDSYENNMNLYCENEVISTINENQSIKIKVPDRQLNIKWSTRYIPNNNIYPYVNFDNFDKTLSKDTVCNIYFNPVEQNRYSVKGTNLEIKF